MLEPINILHIDDEGRTPPCPNACGHCQAHHERAVAILSRLRDLADGQETMTWADYRELVDETIRLVRRVRR